MTTRVPPTRLVYPGTVLEHIGVVVVVVRTELCVVLIVEAVSCVSDRATTTTRLQSWRLQRHSEQEAHRPHRSTEHQFLCLK